MEYQCLRSPVHMFTYVKSKTKKCTILFYISLGIVLINYTTNIYTILLDIKHLLRYER